ncbi:hypothetical protein FF38_05618 [Lucilia cuprina]|uniref:Uncharacterized protein n=1 Tax=Lucilia cuprina TaxID=7375 RepID=A0A0L0BUZ4_LUCCU|nr:hypothetical protein FF38_05618 [Lucilia cuprina]
MEDIVDMDLQQLLTSWNLPHLYELLHNHRITIDVLPILKPHHISKLFNNSHIADEAKFELHLDKYKENVNKQEYQMTGNGDKRKYTPIRNNFSVSDILDNTQSGKLILKYYSKHNTLHDEQRTLLITTISKYLLESGIECSVSSCAGLEKEVCSIFPTEKIEFYQSGNRGKIYNKLANMKRIQKGILKSVNTPEETHSDAFETEENYSVALKNLRCPTVTSEELVIYWRQCAQYRFKEIKESESIKHIFEKWPEYTKSSATQLVKPK